MTNYFLGLFEHYISVRVVAYLVMGLIYLGLAIITIHVAFIFIRDLISDEDMQ